MLVIRMYCEIRPDAYVYKRHLNFLEAVRIRGARHVYPDGVIRLVMSVMCHHEVRGTCSQEEGSLQG